MPDYFVYSIPAIPGPRSVPASDAPIAEPILFNQPPVTPNTGTPVSTTKDSTGKTVTVHGAVAGVTVNNPG